MVLEIVISAVLLTAGIAVLVIIHVCIGGSGSGSGRTSGMSEESIEISTMVQRSGTMSEDDLKKLPWYDYKLDEEDDAKETKRVECAVCLESFRAGDKCRLLPYCRHNFHANCIDSWLIKTAACPICRTCVDLRTSWGGKSRFSSDVRLELT